MRQMYSPPADAQQMLRKVSSLVSRMRKLPGCVLTRLFAPYLCCRMRHLIQPLVALCGVVIKYFRFPAVEASWSAAHMQTSVATLNFVTRMEFPHALVLESMMRQSGTITRNMPRPFVLLLQCKHAPVTAFLNKLLGQIIFMTPILVCGLIRHSADHHG